MKSQETTINSHPFLPFDQKVNMLGHNGGPWACSDCFPFKGGENLLK